MTCLDRPERGPLGVLCAYSRGPRVDPWSHTPHRDLAGDIVRAAVAAFDDCGNARDLGDLRDAVFAHRSDDRWRRHREDCHGGWIALYEESEPCAQVAAVCAA